MNIALLGYGKMGRAIEKIALQKGHKIVLKTNRNSDIFNLENVDVAIDFSTPHKAFNNIYTCLSNKTPIISGTTGWLEKYDEIIAFCKKKNGSFIYASNFSLGVNLFFELNAKLAKLMKDHKGYNVAIEEIHHTQKLDVPSGTAISLAKPILKNYNMQKWVLGVTNNDDELPIIANRIDKIHGTHCVKYTSKIDEIEIKHTARSREGFALGAIIAAEWLINKEGIFTMKDVLFK
ncbi:MAG: 4-hydroxy-tetrahydrodipicolinate reductase [Flavobacteriaceae bacterium]|nr:4-hydroxy-tetrahydrodipicolinate reductase [Flavobacteriaceae bacterium]